jgi:hypothetical protein
MPRGALKRGLKCMDFFYEKQEHEKSSSVLGGMLTVACVVAAVVYIILAFVLDEPAFIESTTLVKTGGRLDIVTFNNTTPFETNITYTFANDSPCSLAIQASSYAFVLEWNTTLPGKLPPGLPTELPVCQDVTAKSGLASANAVRNGLRFISFYPSNLPFWITVLSPDGSVNPLPSKLVNREVPVSLTRDRQTDANNNILVDSWIPTTGTGVAFDHVDCGKFTPFSAAQTCDTIVITLAPSFLFYNFIEEPFSTTDWVFDRILVVTTIFMFGGTIKLAFRRAKREYKKATGKADEGDTATPGIELTDATTV